VPNESRSQGIPLIDGSSVYVDEHPGTIEKRDLFSGELIWKHETDSYATTSVILSGDFVLFGGSSAASEQISLYCLDKGTGSRVWTKSGGIGGFETDPVVHGGSVFWSDCDARLSAFDSHGDVAWQYRRSTSTAFVPFGEFVLAGSGDEVLCFNA